MKVFEFDARKGSLKETFGREIDYVDRKGFFKQSPKGLVFMNPKLKGHDLVFIQKPNESYGNTFSVALFFKREDSKLSVYGRDYICKYHDTGAAPIYVSYNVEQYGATDRYSIALGTNTYTRHQSSAKLKEYNCLVFTVNGNRLISYLNGVMDINKTFDGDVAWSINSGVYMIAGETPNNRLDTGGVILYRFYDHVLTDVECARIYQEFLASKPLSAPTSGFVYPKPTSLDEPGLLAAYNFKRTGNTLVDISGNGLDGTITSGVVSTESGLQFSGYPNYVQTTGNIPLSGDVECSISCRVKPTLLDNNYRSVCGIGNSLPNKFVAITLLKGRPAIDFWGPRVRANTQQLFENEWATLTVTKTPGQISTTSKLYVNGKEVEGSLEGNDIIPTIDLNSLIMGILPSAGIKEIYQFIGEIEDLRVYNREITADEIKAYHNSFATRLYFYDDFRFGLADEKPCIPKGWNKASGSFVVKEDNNKKYVECTTAGVIYIPYNEDIDVDAVIVYDTGSGWVTAEDTLQNLITSLPFLSHANSQLRFSLAKNNKLRCVKIYRGKKV